MYRRTKFLEILLEIRQEMAAEADYDVVLFAELARSGNSEKAAGKRKRLTVPNAVSKASAKDTFRRDEDLVSK